MIALAALCLAAALAMALLLLIAARALGWRRRAITLLVRPLLLAVWLFLTVGLAAAGTIGVAGLDRVGWTLLASWLAASLLLHLVDRPWRLPVHGARLWGGRLAYGGVLVAAGGLVLSAAFTSTAERRMAPGERTRFNAWTIELHEVWPAAGKDWAGVSAELRASSGRGAVRLEPRWRTYADRGPSAEPATIRSGSGILTARIGPRNRDGDWPVRLSSTPMLVMIPLGLALAAFGGAVAMVGPPVARRCRLRRARLATAWWA